MVLDSRVTLAENSVKDPTRETEELLARGLPYITAIDDQTILLRDGDLMASFAIEGISASTCDENDIEDIAIHSPSLGLIREIRNTAPS